MHKVSLERIATEEPILPSPTGLLRRLAAIYPTFLVAFLLSWMGRCLLECCPQCKPSPLLPCSRLHRK